MAAIGKVERPLLVASTAPAPPLDKNLFYIAFNTFEDEDHWVRARRDRPNILWRHQYTQISLALDNQRETLWIHTKDLEMKFTETASQLRTVLQYVPHLFVPILYSQAKKCTPAPISIQEMEQAMTIGHEKAQDPELKCYRGVAIRTLIAGQGVAYALFTQRNRSHDKVIGSGGLKQVKLALGLNDSRIFALGVCRRDYMEATDWEIIPNEIALLHQLRGIDGVIQIEAALETENKFYILTEWYNQGSLLQLMEERFQFSFDEKIAIAKNLALGLSNMHALQILHRDLKPSNILISIESTGLKKAVIGDLGSAARLTDRPFIEKRTGTFAYLPPEKLASIEDKAKTEEWVQTSTKAADIWSLGLVFFSLFHRQTGTLMNFQTVRDIRQRMESLSRDEIQHELLESGIDPSLQLILMNMLNLDPARRVTALWVYKELEKKAPGKGGYYQLDLDVPLTGF